MAATTALRFSLAAPLDAALVIPAGTTCRARLEKMTHPLRIPVPAVVWQDIDAVRLPGLTNMLDRPCLYRRVLVPVCIAGMIQPAWLYIGDCCLQPDLRLIPSGTWGRTTH